MTKPYSKLHNYLPLLFVVYLLTSWWALPDALDKSTSQEIVASAILHSPLGGRKKVILTSQESGALWIRCGQIPALCAELEVQRLNNLRVWIVADSPLREPRVVAVVDNQRVIVSIEEQRERLASAQFSTGVLALLAAMGAILHWYFFIR